MILPSRDTRTQYRARNEFIVSRFKRVKLLTFGTSVVPHGFLIEYWLVSNQEICSGASIIDELIVYEWPYGALYVDIL